DRHRHRKRSVLGVDELMPDEKWTGGKERKRDQPSDRAANAARRAPDHDQTNQPNDGTEKPPGLEQREGRDLGDQCGKEDEAAARDIEVDDGDADLIRKTDTVERDKETTEVV